MLKSLYPSIQWGDVDTIGLDMDGTLYDEAEFIFQVYEPIAEILSSHCDAEPESIRRWLFRRWLEKGSSYSRIFEEALTREGISGDRATAAISRCVEAFRSFSPRLTLPLRVQAILDAMREDFPLFLISDGSARLQARKFDSLRLERWFDSDNVALCGYHGADYAKPNTCILSKVRVLSDASHPNRVLFFGDRRVDAQFAGNAGFQFAHVRSMYPVASEPPQ